MYSNPDDIFMKKSLLFAIIALTCIGSFFAIYESKADTCGGRCTGSAYCTACKNCSGCKHCNSGGSCGVCAAPEPEPAPVKKKSVPLVKSTPVVSSPKLGTNRVAKSSSTKSKSKTVLGSSSDSNIHTVKAASINIRKEPSAKGEIICTLHHKKSVRILKKVDAIWVEIEAFCDNNNRRVTGYVHRSVLK